MTTPKARSLVAVRARSAAIHQRDRGGRPLARAQETDAGSRRRRTRSCLAPARSLQPSKPTAASVAGSAHGALPAQLMQSLLDVYGGKCRVHHEHKACYHYERPEDEHVPLTGQHIAAWVKAMVRWSKRARGTERCAARAPAPNTHSRLGKCRWRWVLGGWLRRARRETGRQGSTWRRRPTLRCSLCVRESPRRSRSAAARRRARQRSTGANGTRLRLL